MKNPVKFLKRLIQRRYTDWEVEMFGAPDKDKVKQAFQQYEENKALAQKDLEKRVQAIETFIDRLKDAF